jgi:hypothetical protein
MHKWYVARALEAAERYGLPVMFRPHPMALKINKKQQNVPGCKTLNGSLSDALARARTVITFNSNTGVDAILAGRHTVVTDEGGMAWPVAAREVGGACYSGWRVLWAHMLAWKQWSMREIENGDALVGIVNELRSEERGEVSN